VASDAAVIYIVYITAGATVVTADVPSINAA
jgi:hypothetical protein